MRRRAIGYLAVVVALAACQSAPAATGTAEDEAAIKELGPKYAAAWNAGDAAALAQLVTEDYQNVEADGSATVGRAAVEAMEKTQAEERKALGLVITITPVQFQWVNAKTAVSSGTWSMKGVPAGGGPDKGSYLVVSKKGDDGQWRMSNALAAAFVPPPPPAAPGK